MEPCAEWAIVIEAQQREIETLRRQASCCWIEEQREEQAGYLVSSSGTTLSQVSSKLSPSVLDNSMPLDLERYAKLCDKMELMQKRLLTRDVRIRKAKAKQTAQEIEIQHYREHHSRLEMQVSQLTTQLERAQGATKEAIDRAAESLMRQEELRVELVAAEDTAQSLRQELCSHRRDKSRDLEPLLRQYQEECHSLGIQLKKFQLDHARLQLENQRLQCEHEQLQEEAHSMRCVKTELSKKNESLEARIAELESVIPRQTDRNEKQQRALQWLEEKHQRLQNDFAVERSEERRHAAHLLQTTIGLQRQVDLLFNQLRAAKQSLEESNEVQLMLGEEIVILRSMNDQQKNRLREQQEKSATLLQSNTEARKIASSLEASRGKLISELAQTKRQALGLHAALEALHSHLQRLGKAVSGCRDRYVHEHLRDYYVSHTIDGSEISIGRALREYGKRNRALQQVVTATKQQVRVDSACPLF